MFIKPDYNLKSIYEINLENLKNQGIKAMLFDLDSTLMASKSGSYFKETQEWLAKVKKDFFIAIVSNNKNPEYIAKVKAVTDFPCVFDAKKPKIDVVQKFLNQNNLLPKDCVLVGDRPLTDILCGKNLGCKTILVDSITADTESKLVRFVRALERLSVKR